jgi:hypothetical protein
MVTASYHKEGFRFRFIRLSSSTASRLRNSIQHIEIQSRKPEVVLLELDESTDLEPLYRFLASEAIDPKTYSIWVSVVSSSDHDGISLPHYILDLIRKTNCGIDFSFVASLGSDDGIDEADSEVTHNRT